MINLTGLILKVAGSNVISWLLLPINFLFLILDGIVYTLVAMAYKVFQMMAQLNFNTLGSLFTSLTDRVRAIIAVLILFIIGYSLIVYLVNPDKAADKNKAGGLALIKNIAISSILLISYTTIFGILNEFTLLLVGTPDTYNYIYLGPIFKIEGTEKDDGLIMRFINGGNNVDDETEDIDFGRKLAVTTLSSFLHGFEEDGLYSRSEGYDKSIIGQIFNSACSDEEFNLIFSLPSAAAEVGRSVYYFPLLSTALGAYIVYMLATVSIQLGIRAFKLLVLQLMAPIAIITIMKDGWNASIWKKYIDVLGKTYVDAFVRIAAMYFSFSFISLAYNNLNKIFDGAKDLNGITKIALYGIIIVAVLKLGKEIPSMIDSVFGSKLSENNKVGLGQFLSAAGGYVLGSASGGISGAATRYRNAKANGAGKGRALASGLLGGISGAATGGVAGTAAGFKNKGGQIAGVIKDAWSEGARVGAPGIGGLVAGAADNMGIRNVSFTQEKQTLDNFESRRKAVRAAAGEQKVSYQAITKSFTDSSGQTHTYEKKADANITFDYSKDKASAVQAALRKDDQYQRIVADTQSTDILVAQNATIAKRDWETEYSKAFDKGGGEIDRKDAQLVNMAENIARSNGNYTKDKILDSGSTIGKIRNDIALRELNRRGFNNPTGGGGKK